MQMACLDREGNRIEASYIVVRDPDYLDYKLYCYVGDGEYQLKRICHNYEEAQQRIMLMVEGV